MRQACVQAVQAAAGRVLKQSEIDGIDTMIKAELRKMASMDREAFSAMSPDARLAEAGKRAGQRLVHEAAKNRQRVVQRINLHAFIERNGGATLDGLRRLIESDADNRSTVQSLESKIQATRTLFLSRMLQVWEATNPRIFGLFADRAGEAALVKEFYKEDSGNATAKQAAKVWDEQTGLMMQLFNASGGDIPIREDWRFPQHHGQARVHKAGKEQWVSDLLPFTKREDYVHEDGTQFSEKELIEFLGHAWETIASGGLNKIDPELQVSGQGNSLRASLAGTRAGRGTANVANRGNVSRQIHFKDAASYMAYQAKYGERDLYSVLVGHVEALSRDIASVQTFGDNPAAMVAHFLKRGEQEAFARGVPAERAAAQARKIQSTFDHISGRRESPANETMARAADSLRQWLSASRLGSAVISSFSDEATMMVTAALNGVSYMKAFRNQLSFLASGENRAMARRAGLGLDSVISQLNRFGHDGLGASFSSKLANAVMQAQGLNMMTDARKAGFGTVMYSAIGDLNTRVDFADLDPVDNRILLGKGITERDWTIWKLAQREDWGNGNNTMLTPDSIMRIPLDQIPEVQGSNAASVRFEAAQKLLGAVLDEVDTAVITPRASERARMIQFFGDPQRGTLGGELARSVLQFKSFPLAVMMRHWRRAWAQPGPPSRLKYAAAMIGLTTIAGMASIQVSQLLAGKDPKNMNPFEGKNGVKNWFAALLKGGSLGFYGDFLFSDQTKYGQGPLAALQGPVIGAVDELFGLSLGNLNKLRRGEDVHVGAGAVRTIQGVTPGASLWYAKAALNHFVFQRMQEELSPGYLRKTKARAEREFGDSYWWEPGPAPPQRPPALERAVGQ